MGGWAVDIWPQKMAFPPLKRQKLDHESSFKAREPDATASPDESLGEGPVRASYGNASTNMHSDPVKARDGKAVARPTDMYSMDMFQMQVRELVGDVQLNYDERMPKVEETLRRLKALIESIPPRGPLSVRLDGQLPPALLT
jgi:hypothetical protein